MFSSGAVDMCKARSAWLWCLILAVVSLAVSCDDSDKGSSAGALDAGVEGETDESSDSDDTDDSDDTTDDPENDPDDSAVDSSTASDDDTSTNSDDSDDDTSVDSDDDADVDSEDTDVDSDDTDDPPVDDEIAAIIEGCEGTDIEITVGSDGSTTIRCGGVVIRVEGSPRDDTSDADTDDPDDADTDDPDDADTDDTDDNATDDDASTPDTGLCRPIAVGGAELLPARSTVVSSTTPATPTAEPIFVKDVFDRFKSVCGGCHVDAGLGNLQVKFDTFTRTVNRNVVDTIKATSASDIMPPGSPPFSSRGPSDPVRELYDLLIMWRDAVEPIINAGGKEPTVFFPPAPTTPPGASPFQLTPTLGAAMTNLGTCIPDPGLVSTENEESAAKDTFFETTTALPKTLQETDLTTLDSFELARRGVISYAPTYPLFSDDAGKMRYVRVPRGQSVNFNPATQEFDVPPNTRFYKTFLKQVKDAQGNTGRWKKIETRLIVSRPDEVLPNGSLEPTALFGTYIWNEEETQATLLEDPLRNGKPFRDRIFLYLTDEVEGKAELLKDPPPPNLERELMENRWGRHYGVPGSERCVGCHRGANNHNFILGFGPLQVQRQPFGTQGTYEAAGSDELTQLQRLIDYGVITGVSDPEDPAEIFPLDLSQVVEPRTPQELTTQAYMVGNCAFCHNPDGLASVENPVLSDILDWWPDAHGGGIFGFPLNGAAAFSPRIRRGDGGTMRIPYVSPSLEDRPGAADRHQYYPPPGTAAQPIAAPWRSLIYRNVDSPFMYAHDSALYPHMPLHVPGFDQRAPRIMGEWVVSIPARLVDDPLPHGLEQPFEEVFLGDDDYEAASKEATARLEQYRNGGRYDCVPYDECLAANAPTSSGGGGNACRNPCPDTRDIVSHDVLAAVRGGTDALTPDKDGPYNSDADLIPDGPHWVNTDLTQPPIEGWEPRRPDWPSVLFCGDGVPDPGEACDDGPEGSATCTRTCKRISCDSDTLTAADKAECARPAPTNSDGEKVAVELLRNARMTDAFRELALGERPMTVWADWKDDEECEMDDLPTPSTYAGPGPSGWFEYLEQTQLTDKLYFQSPGEAIFSNICANCHGPTANSEGRQATAVALMSGGETRVANLRDGILVAGNAQTVFSPFNNAERTTTDLAARYMSWMALGGTLRTIPGDILDLVRRTQVYGHSRKYGQVVTASPNMLEAAITMCSQLVGYRTPMPRPTFLIAKGGIDHADADSSPPPSSLIGKTGDAEMWRDICSHDNPAPILVIAESFNWANATAKFSVHRVLNRTSSTGRPVYADETLPSPELVPVGNANGQSVIGLRSDNELPWCVLRADSGTFSPLPADRDALAAKFAADWEGQHSGQKFPFCPPDLIARNKLGLVHRSTDAELDRWARRGAINAGFAVFAYLQAVQEGLLPQPAYNDCRNRPKF